LLTTGKSVQYTQQQVRSAIGVRPETFRYWKQCLTPLHKRDGKAPLFSVGEMLALSIVSQLVQLHKMDVSAIKPVAEQLFNQCSRPLLFSSQEALLWISIESEKLAVVRDVRELPVDCLYMVVPISQLWQRISDTLTDVNRPGEQRELLPLASVN